MRIMILPLSVALSVLPIPAQTSNQPNSTSQQSTSGQSNSSANSSSKNNSGNGNNSASSSPKVNLSRAGARMLTETDQARMAIANKNKQTALQHVNQAINSVDRIESVASGRSFVPIYTELSEVSLLGPVQRAKSQSAGQNSGSSSTNSSSANNTGSNSSQSATQTRSRTNPSVVQSVAGEYTTVAVNVNTAKTHLQAAQTALNNNGDFTTADRALMEVQNGVVLETVAADLPLLKARQDLALAKARADRGDFTQASAALRSASNGLQSYAQTNGTHASDASALQKEIDNYAQNIQSVIAMHQPSSRGFGIERQTG